MGEQREVPILQFFGNLATNAGAFADDLVDAIDAAIDGGAYEELSDMPKPILKKALKDVIEQKIHGPLSDNTITCEA